MTDILWTTLLFTSVTLIVSQGSNKCGQPRIYENRRLDEKYLLISEFKDGDKVTYKCDKGYTQWQGRRDSTCFNGHWSSLNMQCKKKKCGSAGDIVNGKFHQDGNLFGDKAYAECNTGYVLQGMPFRECLDNGWSGTIPNCIASHSFSKPFHTPARASDRIREAAAARVVTCRRPTAQHVMLNGTKHAYRPGERLLFSCHEGFHMQGNSKIIQCGQDGKWSPRPMKCAKIKCPSLNVLNSVINIVRRVVNTTVTVSCKEDFHLSGAKHITCEANGSWTPAVPTCEPNSVPGQCGQLPFHPNAFPRDGQLDQYKDRSQVRFRCIHGYIWAGGNETIYCDNGHWTSLQLICRKKKCGSAGELENGHFDYTGVSFGDTATAKCNEGYQLVGEAMRHCRAEGWDGRKPVCEVVKCSNPPEVPGAEMYGPTDDEPIRFGDLVSYRCLTGTLVGSQEIFCTEKGTWSASAPQCRGVVCPFPHMKFGSRSSWFQQSYQTGNSVEFTCNPGWRLVGARTVTCGTDGKWKPALPKCIRV
ncbi:CUB and sushi domain-containing protein 1 [Electrophorus electricus]|uniref:CUB and sushi domain-containing protein 1 n=1 Tax=Electrophorus electricus TaxID=8005 RepID=UPI0015CFB77D|nr:CUB and sushi domain-containing protein 1 [Electrophorus electricus]